MPHELLLLKGHIHFGSVQARVRIQCFEELEHIADFGRRGQELHMVQAQRIAAKYRNRKLRKARQEAQQIVGKDRTQGYRFADTSFLVVK